MLRRRAPALPRPGGRRYARLLDDNSDLSLALSFSLLGHQWQVIVLGSAGHQSQVVPEQQSHTDSGRFVTSKRDV